MNHTSFKDIGTKELEIKKIQKEQLRYGNQLAALENFEITSFEEKKTLREYYLSKQDELQKRINSLINDYPVIDSEIVIVRPDLFSN
jgi:hypothetical protein